MECEKVQEMGYACKMCLHSNQFVTVNEAFAPSTEEIALTRKIIEAAESQGTVAI
jgi:citrate lyase beta subunit